MARVYLSLGSNIGDRKKYLTHAISLLGENPKIKLGKISSIYETIAQGFTDQADFLNIVLEVETQLSPLELLELGQKIEQELDRKKLFHWGPRTIDIDIISYDDLQMDSDRLIIPHKEALNRAFVLLPLLEITGDDFELNGVKIKEALERTPHDENIIWLYQETVPF
jgi:2-amino-4-hydroxy-6-hydroxymethyldihydropteridine diphosphokinase